jgi:hypothetical protein
MICPACDQEMARNGTNEKGSPIFRCNNQGCKAYVHEHTPQLWAVKVEFRGDRRKKNH